MDSNLNGLKSTNKFEYKKKYIISYKENNNQATPSEEPDFNILSSSEEMFSREFNLVEEDYLKSKSKDESSYLDKCVFSFEIEGKKYILIPNENKIVLEIDKANDEGLIQECNENSSPPQKENKDNQVIYKITKEEKKNRIRNLIQLYNEEMNLSALFDKNININNEKDMKEYYLINNNWMNMFKEDNNYQKIKEIISKDKKFLNEEEFLRVNFNEISKEIKDLPEKLLKVENFIPRSNLNFCSIEESKDLFCPQEFALVSVKLFDSFYKEITKKLGKNNKDDYKYKIIIGDNVLFIQDKKHDNVFYAFTKDKNNNIELCSYLFKYNDNDKKMFFDDIKNYIQNKGFEYYLIERNIQFHTSPKLDILYNQGKEIGKYISYKPMNTDTYKKMKIKYSLIRNQSSYVKYKLINDKILKNNKKINLSNAINEINNKQNINNYIDVIVILNDEFEKLKNNLYFSQVKELLELKDKKEEKLEKMVNDLVNSNYDAKNYVKNIKLIKPNEIAPNNKYNFINKDFLVSINNSKDFIDSLPEEYYFIGNNEKLIFYPKEQNLYKVEFDNSNNFFKLKEYEFILGYKEIVEKLKDLYKIETNIENQIKSTALKKISKSDNYYLVNKKWMKEFKTFYDYDNVIIKNKKNNSSKNQKFPDNLNKNEYLNTELDKNICNDANVPINFEIFDKKNFDLIIKEINDKNIIKLELKYFFNIYLGDNKIFVQDDDNKFLYFIYSLNNKEYTLDNIIKFNQIDNIKNFITKCEANEKFEDLLIRYGIKLSSQGDDQNLIDDNYKLIGVLKNIKSKQIQGKKHPDHCLGLQNIGATCYMNATIQCLCHVANVKNYFQDKQLVYNDTNNKNCRLTKEFNKLVNNLWKEPVGNISYYTPTDFKDCISEMNPLFRGIAANDSKDLIIFLYETIHNEINKQGDYQEVNGADELTLFRNDYYSKNSSFLIKTFYFEVQSDLKCQSCQFNKSSYNIANVLIFPLEKVREYKSLHCTEGFMSVTLEDCFIHYQVEELLCGENQIYCNACNRMADAQTKNLLFTSPEVMTIILNRGKGLEFEVNFEYPLVLDIDKYVCQKEGNDNNKYELICVLSHYGESSMSGHFIAFCKSPVDNKWYCYNDAIVTKTEDPRRQSSGNYDGIPYVLYYQKVKHKENLDKITLYFNYGEGKQLFLDVDKNMKAKDMINTLINKYKLPKNITLLYEKGNNIKIQGENTIKSYNLVNKSIITVK